jgi:hypothetical protein
LPFRPTNALAQPSPNTRRRAFALFESLESLARRDRAPALTTKHAVQKQAHIPGFRLAVAGVGSLVLLSGMVFPIFALFGRTLCDVIPPVLCVFILVILLPVVVRGSWKDRLLALLLAIFPAVLLLSIIVFSLAFAR